MAGGRDEQRVTTWDHDEDTSSVMVHGARACPPMEAQDLPF